LLSIPAVESGTTDLGAQRRLDPANCGRFQEETMFIALIIRQGRGVQRCKKIPKRP
jgi:hypothetical protein